MSPTGEPYLSHSPPSTTQTILSTALPVGATVASSLQPFSMNGGCSLSILFVTVGLSWHFHFRLLRCDIVAKKKHRIKEDRHQATKEMDDSNDISKVTRLFARQNLHDVPAELLQKVTPEDRMESLHDVHGVFQPVQETEQFVQEKLNELRLYLRCDTSTPGEMREAYDQIAHESPQFVDNQLIKFLRADTFDVRKAATRVFKHFQAKKEFFGAELLGKEIQLKDLNELDQQVLNEGAVQLLNKRDRSGRAILTQFPRVCYYYPAAVSAKLLFWSSMMAARDEETQRRGLVVIFYGVKAAKIERDGRKRAPEYAATLPCMPLRVAAVHCCFHDEEMRQTLSTLSHFVESRYFIRFQSHFGNHQECQFNLMTFGIPPSSIPVLDDGSLNLESHRAWLTKLKIDEGSCPIPVAKPVEVEPPGPWDVIMGRGLRGRKSPGNQLLKLLLEERRDEYDSSSRVQKAAIVKEIYTIMHRKGCRFLAPTSVDKADFNWIEVTEEAARDRIGHGFRNLRLVAKK